MSASRIIFRVLIPLCIVGSGAAGAYVMLASTATAEKSTPTAEPLPVTVIEVERGPATARVTGTGVVEPARRVTISPEVSGRVVRMADTLVVGGRVAAGEVILGIDPRDYRLEVATQKHAVARAELEVELEQGRGRVAEREWALLGRDRPEGEGPDPRIVLRKPQAESASLSVQTARRALERAQLALSRTTIKAPFNATVIEENVEMGQLVQPGSQVATLVGTDSAWVRVSVPVDQLAMVRFPSAGAEDGAHGSLARVSARLGEGAQASGSREGRVLRLVGELDPQTRRAQILVQIDDPLDPPAGQLPLLPGTFVDVVIEGPTLPETLKIPRSAVVEGDRVLVANRDDELDQRRLQIAWGDETHLYATGGLEAGDRIITDKVAPAITGAPLAPRVGKASAETPTPPSEGSTPSGPSGTSLEADADGEAGR